MDGEMTLIPLDRKKLILEDAKKRILKNHTLEQKIEAIETLMTLNIMMADTANKVIKDFKPSS